MLYIIKLQKLTITIRDKFKLIAFKYSNSSLWRDLFLNTKCLLVDIKKYLLSFWNNIPHLTIEILSISGCKFVPFIFISSLLITPFHPTRRRSAKLNGASNERTERFKSERKKFEGGLSPAEDEPRNIKLGEHLRLSFLLVEWRFCGREIQLSLLILELDSPSKKVSYYRHNWDFIYFGGK